VVIATRNRSLLIAGGPDQIAFLTSLTGRPAGGNSVHLLYADLSTLSSVKNFASELTANFPVVDCLICNAGVMAAPGRGHLTTDGFELHFGVNHLGRRLSLD
jgi:NAD(P)-dependent dehydrogenase (short-subunit alcohol dehydrogenase family)